MTNFDDMTWSFSRIHSWEQCPYSFYLKYIENRDGESNFYAENGKAMHETFEKIARGKLPLSECTGYYSDKFDLICEETKQSIMDSTFEKCIEYLSEMEWIDESKYEIIGAEMEFRFKVGKYNFVGYADLLLRERETGRIILVDHKQEGHFFKKDGTPLKNHLDSYLAYRNQMYLYCKGIKDCLGLDVDLIVWHHFKDDGKLSIIQFDEEQYKKSQEWAISTIEKIKEDKAFDAKESFIMCSSLCGYRNDCEYRNTEE